MEFAFKSPSWGNWNSAPTGLEEADNLSLAFGPNDETGIAAVDDGELSVASFDPVAGGWVSELLDTGLQSARVNLVYNSLGQPALSYVAEDGLLHYRINEGSGWLDYILADTDPLLNVEAMTGTEASLAFDYDDVPVIAYYGQDGIMLAYDPIIVPEPASVLLLIVGSFVLRRTKKESN